MPTAGAGRPHLAFRIDAQPPSTPPQARRFWCPSCGYLTGAALVSAGPHEIPGPGRVITRADLNLPDPAPHLPGCECIRCLLTRLIPTRK